MNQVELFQWMYSLPISELARSSVWLWPTLESLHFIGLCLLFGSLLIVDLRVLGVGKSLVKLESVMPFIPIALAGGVINLLTGLLFFMSNPDNYWSNWAFRWKMALFVLGALNALAFELFERRRLSALPAGTAAGFGPAMISTISLSTWLVVIVLGRILPYTSSGVG